jgi:hypothetical protein
MTRFALAVDDSLTRWPHSGQRAYVTPRSRASVTVVDGMISHAPSGFCPSSHQASDR